ncbi:SusC/RagA family TonB-linked outer membrane protein [Mucilaginibacter sp. X5P1]|uniref:SusC/RagA family TonB-linked outer membrane protein n=1 Tax=Mucilaginibacter sp. X5P1 TaxID=2723088 RepID=UPI00161B88F3|nr:TonB-dependent receptor [Mucilaginibacter sp. X5P1]MBB6138302.1 TonB-linked SusC/RagA family outer membrane protein [Mucilaginibacter sp. X5P1]
MNKRDFTFKTKWKETLLVFCLFLATCITAFAQSRQVTGKVADATTNEAIPGASIKIQGTSVGTVSDLQGNFKINVADGQVLVASFIGYEPMEIPVTGLSVTIKLKENSKDLNEVVVVGYGTQKKATLTGAITTIDAKAFQNKGTVTNPLEALEGQVPGVIITRQSSAPGQEGWNLQVRGATSTNGSTPLLVIDGAIVPDNNALNAINPNDIASMSFLKDGAAAIYGARAAGGVVLITTKRGTSGKTTVTYDGSFSRKIIGDQVEQMTLQQYATGLIQARENDGYLAASDYLIHLGELMLKYQGQVISATNFPAGQFFQDGTPIPAGNPIPQFPVLDYTFFNTNYQDQLFKNGVSNQQNFGISGGTDKSKYRLSLGYAYDGSLIRYGDDYNTRYNIRFSNDYSFSDKVKLQSNIALDKDNVIIPSIESGATGIFSYGFQPGSPAFAENGLDYAWGANYSPEGLARDGGDNKTYTTRWTINENLNWQIVDHLSFNTTLSFNPTTITNNTQQKSIQWYDYSGTEEGVQYPTPTNAFYSEYSTTDNYYNANAYLDYKNTFNKHHNVSLTVGGQYERDEYNTFSATTTDQSLNAIPGLSNGIGDATTHSNSGYASHYAFQSIFGRFNYDYDSKYLLEAQIRDDGSSKFIAADRYKPFYGVSGGWLITQEPFMKSQHLFDELKIRASYGTAGNQGNIGLYDYLQLLNLSYGTSVTSSNPYLGTGQAVTLGPTSTLVSLNRTWEKIETYNLGLDFEMFKNRLTGSVDGFIKNNVNMLLPVVYPSVLGATAPYQNVGYLRTKGGEAQLNWADKIGNVGYHIGGNITYNTDKVISYQGATVINAGINTVIQGQPLNSVYGLEYAGRIQNQSELTNYLQQYSANNSIGIPANLRVGDNMFKDVNGDGKINNSDLVNLGTEDPRISYSFNFGVNYKGFDFSAIFQGVGKRTIFRNDNARIPFGSWYWSQDNFSVGKTWTPSNTSAYYPLLSNTSTINNYNYQASSFSVENGEYLRCKNIVLGYTLPTKLVQRSKFINRLRVYLSANDLFEFDKINDGFDPEAPSTLKNSYTQYPFYRLLTAGVNLTF